MSDKVKAFKNEWSKLLIESGFVTTSDEQEDEIVSALVEEGCSVQSLKTLAKSNSEPEAKIVEKLESYHLLSSVKLRQDDKINHRVHKELRTQIAAAVLAEIKNSSSTAESKPSQTSNSQVQSIINNFGQMNLILQQKDVINHAYKVHSDIDQSKNVEEKLFHMYQEYQRNNPHNQTGKSPYYYSPYTTICQSSGYGKSRTVELMSKSSKFYIQYCCFRDPGQTGCPKKSLYADILLNPNSPEDAEKTFRAYVHCLFNIIVNEQQSPQDFYNRYSVRTDEDNPFQERLAQDIKDTKSKDNFAISPNKNLRDLSPLLLVFDEAKALIYKELDLKEQKSEPNKPNPPANLFLALRLFLQNLQLPVFALFIDTTSKISNFVPCAIKDRSARVENRGAVLFPPIYNLPTFDAFRHQSSKKIDSLSDAIQFESICSFGRPLWGSLIRARKELLELNEHVDYSDRALLRMAATKLTGGSVLSMQFDQKESEVTENILSILSVRCGTVQPVHEAIAESLVSSHMATIIKVTKERHLLEISYPSEPILALASAHFYWASSNMVGLICSKLASIVQSNLVDKGAVGEMAMKIALLHAFDKANSHSSSDFYDSKSEKVTGKYVTVKDYLVSLLGEQVIEQIRCQMEDSQAEKLLNGYVSFSHFYKPANKKFDLKCMKLLMRRGVAGECKKNNEKIDIVIPIVFGLDGFGEMSAIQIQIKLWEEVPRTSRKKLEEINLSCLGCDKDVKIPSLCIYVHLHANRGPLLTTLLETSDDPKIQTSNACLYAENLSVFNFEDGVKQALHQLCGTVSCDLDFAESIASKYGYDALDSAFSEYRECSAKDCCLNGTDEDEFLVRCLQCRNFYHLGCEMELEPKDNISKEDKSRIISQMTKYAWRCHDCRGCSKCEGYHLQPNSYRCLSCNRSFHKKCVGKVNDQVTMSSGRSFLKKCECCKQA